MSRLGLRARVALLAAALVLIIASLVGAGGYLALRASLLSRADREARDQARQLAALVDVGGRSGDDPQANQVDLGDPSLTEGFPRGGLLVTVGRAEGQVVQATRGARPTSVGLRARCLRDGSAATRRSGPAAAVACARVGPAARPLGTVTVASPLADERRALARLAQALAIGVAAGTLLAAGLARAVAQRALRPARQIAQAADSIRSGDLGRRIDYRGPRDELGNLADVLDACFAELEQGVERQRQFVADASHELRSPIAAMRAHAELLLGGRVVGRCLIAQLNVVGIARHRLRPPSCPAAVRAGLAAVRAGLAAVRAGLVLLRLGLRLGLRALLRRRRVRDGRR
jgi:signal transduction histidine kinase